MPVRGYLQKLEIGGTIAEKITSLSRHCKVFPDAPRASSHSLLVYLWQYSPTPFHRHSTPWSMHEMCSQDVRPFFGDLQIINYLFTTDSLESHWQARSRKSVYLGGHPTCISPCCVIVRHRAMPSLMGPFPLLHCNSGLRIHVYVALSQWKNMQERQPQERQMREERKRICCID